MSGPKTLVDVERRIAEVRACLEECTTMLDKLGVQSVCIALVPVGDPLPDGRHAYSPITNGTLDPAASERLYRRLVANYAEGRVKNSLVVRDREGNTTETPLQRESERPKS